jgi:hypothetical protein
MTRFDGPKEQKELASVLKPDLTIHDVWTLVKFGKHIRRSCRNNAALNPYLSRMFPGFRFEAIPKVAPSGKAYMGLRIVDKTTGLVTEDDDDD